ALGGREVRPEERHLDDARRLWLRTHARLTSEITRVHRPSRRVRAARGERRRSFPEIGVQRRFFAAEPVRIGTEATGLTLVGEWLVVALRPARRAVLVDRDDEPCVVERRRGVGAVRRGGLC